MSPSIKRTKSRFRQVADHLANEIYSGRMQEGDTVPSEEELMTEWAIPRTTASKALAVLRSRGLVEARPGSGAVVLGDDQVPRDPKGRFRTTRTTGRIRLDNERSEFVNVGLVRPPNDVRSALTLAEDQLAIVRRRLIYRSGTPNELATSWFDGALTEVCADLLRDDPIAEGTTQYVERMLDLHGQLEVEETVSVEAARGQDARLLVVGEGDAVLRRDLTVRYGGLVITFEQYVHPQSHRLRYQYRLPAG